MLTFAIKKKRTPSIAPKRHAPTVSPMSHSLHLQQAKVRHILRSLTFQPKLKIGQPNDIYEQEADRVADAVMRMPEPGVQRQVDPEEEEEEETLQAKPLAEKITPFVQVQRQEEPEEEQETLQAKPLAEQISPLVQRQVEPEEEEEEEEEEPIQAKLSDGAKLQRQEEPEEEILQAKVLRGYTSEVTPEIESHIYAMRNGGQPLTQSQRALFEPLFGYDFSQVRMHTDAHAAETARMLNAKAFTTGRDVVFGAGRYAPGTASGKRLLAHELIHVVQQNKAANLLQQKEAGAPPIPEWQERLNAILPGGVGPLAHLDRIIILYKVFSEKELIRLVNEIYTSKSGRDLVKAHGVPGIMALIDTRSTKGLDTKAAKKALEGQPKQYGRAATEKFGEDVMSLRGVLAILKKGVTADSPERYHVWVNENHYNALWDFYKASTSMGKHDRVSWADAGLKGIGDIKEKALYPSGLNNKISSMKTKILQFVDAIKKARDVAIIIGRPSLCRANDEPKEARRIYPKNKKRAKEQLRRWRGQMAAWRAAANGLSSAVVEGYTVKKAVSKLKGIRYEIMTLHIISHGGGGIITEIKLSGATYMGTSEYLKKSIEEGMEISAVKPPKRVNLLYCTGGEAPKGIARLGKAFGAQAVRAPVSYTVIEGHIIYIVHNKKKFRLSAKTIKKPPKGLSLIDEEIRKILTKKDRTLIKLYDFVYGVNHLQKNPFIEIKLNNLVKLLKRTKNGIVPLIAFNESPGVPGSVPYWRAEVIRKKPGAPSLTHLESLSQKKKMVEVIIRAE